MAQPPEDSAFSYYLFLMISLGLFATWCGVGVNLPILSEIVKDDRRATIMAWEGALESSCSAVFGNAMVGVLAQNVFGYDLNNASKDASGHDPTKTQALGHALMLVSFVPWMLCFLSYSLLHCTYERDLKFVRGEGPGQKSMVSAAPKTPEEQEEEETSPLAKRSKPAPVRLG